MLSYVTDFDKNLFNFILQYNFFFEFTISFIISVDCKCLTGFPYCLRRSLQDSISVKSQLIFVL